MFFLKNQINKYKYYLIHSLFMGIPLSKRAKLRHLEKGSERYLRKASVGARIAAVANGQRAVLNWHKKVGTDLDRMKSVLKNNKKNFVDGNFNVPKNMRFKTADFAIGIPTATVLGGFFGGVSGLVIDAFRRNSQSLNATFKGAVIGAGLGAALGVSLLSEDYYNSMRSEFLRLRKLLEKERLVRAKKGEVLPKKLQNHNKDVIVKVEARIIELIEANEMQKKKVEAFLQE